MEKKKLTNAQLQKRIEKAVVFIPRDKDTHEMFFSDKGLRLTVTNEYCIIATGYHRHIFDAFNVGQGLCRSYIYTKRVLEIATQYQDDMKTDDGYSFYKLIETLKSKEDKTEYNLVTYYDWWLYNIFQPLYSIGETEAESFLVFEDYVHNIARNSILLSEHTEGMTNKGFMQELLDNVKAMTDGIDENVLFEKKTDEDVMRENVQAALETETEEAMEAQ